MNKLVIFAVAVFLGVVGYLFIANQSNPQPRTSDINFSLNPSGIPTLQPSSAVSTTPIPIPEATTATIKTEKGDITVIFYPKDAPKAVTNFVELSKKGYYNNVTFHRVEDWVLQGGDPSGTGRGGTSIFGQSFEDELDPNTPSYKEGYLRGVLAMANSGPNTNGSQFFILKKDYPLDHNYTIFGKVTEGMDVVDKMAIGDKILGVTVQ
jgi:cyclophilin family peptidyl-prolyl cis-trans isomerase